jgi:selenocysteine-specific elongation factor
MRVIATAGHVDHGKSALLRALTGMEPDRWAEERRRGLTIDLGFVWTALPSGERLAFVDVPGHKRFVPNMLAGVGPVPAVLFVVAADEGWMPQSAEHLAAIDALGIRHGLLAVSRSDLADPGPALADARKRLSRSSLGETEAVAVSALTGEGLEELRAALARLAARLPDPSPDAPVRLWIDRAFTIQGSGTVVTGTLPAGTIARGDQLALVPAMTPVRVREVQSLGQSVPRASGTARVALNLRGTGRGQLARGMALIEPGAWTLSRAADVRLAAAVTGELPRELTVHIGSARTGAQVRPLDDGLARLTLREALPLHAGDRLLLRDPGRDFRSEWERRQPGARPPALLGAVVLDPAPPPLRRRGAAATAAELRCWPERPSAADLLRRHGLLRTGALRAMGITDCLPEPVTGDWLASPQHWADLAGRLGSAVRDHAAARPLEPGLPVEAARARLGLPDRRLVAALATAARPALQVRDGLVVPAGPQAAPGSLPAPVARAVRELRAELERDPFRAPEAHRLAELGLDGKALAAAERAGLLTRISPQIVLAPGADAAAAAVLARLEQPFTAAQARQALATTRRVVIPLLEHLDRKGYTDRLPGDQRVIRQR